MAAIKNGRRGPEMHVECALPRSNIFSQGAKTIAASLASKEVSPQGPASGMRLLTFYINYAGRRLNPSQRRNLEKARKLLSDRVAQDLREKERQEAA